MLGGAGNGPSLTHAYDGCMEVVLRSPYWSPECPSGLRIPWRLAKEARSYPSTSNVWDFPGLYLFGSAAGVPRYLGETGGTFRKRLQRYVFGRRSQCQLAVDYEQALVERGLEGFPEEIREWYRRGHRTNTARLRGAVDFCQHGIDGIWFTLLPITGSNVPYLIEQLLIPIVNDWNLKKGYPLLVND